MDYESRISLAKARLQRKTTLPKAQSKSILINDCPYCVRYAECSRIIDDDGSHVRQICKIRSNELESVWLNIREDDRPVVKIGDKFGKLTVIIPQKPDNHGNKRWLCKCECGKAKVVRSDNLLTGKTTSCGCDQGKHDKIPASSGRATINNEDVKEQSIASEVLTADLIRTREASEFTSKVGQSVDHSLKMFDKQFVKHEPHFSGKCPDCNGKTYYNDHGFKECRECGLIASDPNWAGVTDRSPLEIEKMDQKYQTLIPQESFGKPPESDLAKFILLEEIEMSDYIDAHNDIEIRRYEIENHECSRYRLATYGAVSFVWEPGSTDRASAMDINLYGVDAFREGDYDAASTFFQRALEIAPDFGRVWLNLAKTYKLLGNLDGYKAAFDMVDKTDW